MTRIQGSPTSPRADPTTTDGAPPPKRPRVGEASSSSHAEASPPVRSQAAAGTMAPRGALPLPARSPRPATPPSASTVTDDMLGELAARPGDVVFGRSESLPLAPHEPSTEALRRSHLALQAFESEIEQEVNELIEELLAAPPDLPLPAQAPLEASLGRLHADAVRLGRDAILLGEQVDQEVADMIAELMAHEGEVAFQQPAVARRRTIDVPPADRQLIATFAEMARAGGSNKSTTNFLCWLMKRFSEWLGQQGKPTLDARRRGEEFEADLALYIEQAGHPQVRRALTHLETAMGLRRLGAIALPPPHRLAAGEDDLRLVDWFSRSAKGGNSNRANVDNAAWSMRLFSTWREAHQLPPLVASLDSPTLDVELDDFVAETGNKNAPSALRSLREATSNEHVLQALTDHQLAEGVDPDAVLTSLHALEDFGQWLGQQGLGVIANRLHGEQRADDVQAYLAQGGDHHVIAALHELREARSEQDFGAVSMPRRPEYAAAAPEDESLIGEFGEKAKLDGMNPPSVDTYASALRRFAAWLAQTEKGTLAGRRGDPTLDADLKAFIDQGGSHGARTGLNHLRKMMPAPTEPESEPGSSAPPQARARASAAAIAPEPPRRIGRPMAPGWEARMLDAMTPTLRTMRVPPEDARLIDQFVQRRVATGLARRYVDNNVAGPLRSFSKWLKLWGHPPLANGLHGKELDRLVRAFMAEGNAVLAESSLQMLRAEFPDLAAATPAMPPAPAPALAAATTPPSGLARPSTATASVPVARSLLNANPIDIEAAISAMRRRGVPRETVERDVGLPPGTLAAVVDPQGAWLDEFAQMRAAQGLSIQQMQDFATLMERLRRQLDGA